MPTDADDSPVQIAEVDQIAGDPAIEVALGAWPLPDGRWRVEIQVRRDSPRDELLLEWVDQRIGRLLEYGPEPDGWGLRPDLGYQLCARPVLMPQLEV